MDETLQYFQEAMERALEDTYQEALRMSLGPYSLHTLSTTFGGPFAKRGARPGAASYPLPPEMINYQTGNFYRGWTRPEIHQEGDNLVGKIQNNTPEATFLKAAGNENSTSIMRPIEPYLQQFLLERLAFYLDVPATMLAAS